MARDAMNIDDGHKHNADFLADVATAEERSFRRNIKVGLRLEFREIEQRTKRAGRSGTWGETCSETDTEIVRQEGGERQRLSNRKKELKERERDRQRAIHYKIVSHT